MTNLTNFIKYWLPVIVWAIVIFLFSANPATRTSAIHWQDFIVKKTAHIVEYAIFTGLMFRGFRGNAIEKRKALYFSLVFAILYGITDEIHQSFTPGREPTVRDVVFDSFGAILSVYVLKNYIPKLQGALKKVSELFELV